MYIVVLEYPAKRVAWSYRTATRRETLKTAGAVRRYFAGMGWRRGHAPKVVVEKFEETKWQIAAENMPGRGGRV